MGAETIDFFFFRSQDSFRASRTVFKQGTSGQTWILSWWYLVIDSCFVGFNRNISPWVQYSISLGCAWHWTGVDLAYLFHLYYRRGGVEELSEEELLTSPLELQLVILNLWPPEPWYDQRFLLVCQKNRCLDGYWWRYLVEPWMGTLIYWYCCCTYAPPWEKMIDLSFVK